MLVVKRGPTVLKSPSGFTRQQYAKLLAMCAAHAQFLRPFQNTVVAQNKELWFRRGIKQNVNNKLISL